jgi:hypothetical protein
MLVLAERRRRAARLSIGKYLGSAAIALGSVRRAMDALIKRPVWLVFI